MDPIISDWNSMSLLLSMHENSSMEGTVLNDTVIDCYGGYLMFASI